MKARYILLTRYNIFLLLVPIVKQLAHYNFSFHSSTKTPPPILPIPFPDKAWTCLQETMSNMANVQQIVSLKAVSDSLMLLVSPRLVFRIPLTFNLPLAG